MFDMAVGAKKAGLKSGYVEHGLWDKIVFSKVKVRVFSSFFHSYLAFLSIFATFRGGQLSSLQARLGGKVRLMVTGSAPIKAEVLDSFVSRLPALSSKDTAKPSACHFLELITALFLQSLCLQAHLTILSDVVQLQLYRELMT
jgi:hypothetical protein